MNTIKTKIIASIFTALIGLAPNLSVAESYLGNLDIRTNDGKELIEISGKPGASFDHLLQIKNYSAQKTMVSLYAIDAEIINGQFTPVKSGQNRENIQKWISLENEPLSLYPGETKNVLVKINYPATAGIGKHYGAIMADQVLSGPADSVINLSSGIRIYSNVEGIPDPKYKIINPHLVEENGKTTYFSTLYNSGNTNLSGQISLMNQTGLTKKSPTEKVNIKPGEDQKITLSIESPAFGLKRLVSEISLNNDSKSFVLQEGYQLPGKFWVFIGTVFFLLSLILIWNKTRPLELQKKSIKNSVVFLLLVMFTLIIALNLSKPTGLLGKADLLNQKETNSYLTTIKWGDLEKRNLPKSIITNWDGRLKLNNGEMFIVEKLHNEKTDQILLNSSGNTLKFKNLTGPDNDGIILLIKTPADEPAPTLTLHNMLTGEEIPIQLKQTLTKSRIIKYKQHEIEISSEIAPDIINVKDKSGNTDVPLDNFGKVLEVPVIVTEIESSPDNSEIILENQSTPDQMTTSIESNSSDGTDLVQPSLTQSHDLNEEIALLKELIQDIPSSPDVVSEYILNSTFVKTITSENNTTTVNSDPVLIDTLKDTPLTIQELTSTPDLNFVFLPNKTIKMTTQPFSFTEEKISSQELNEMVFIQRKEIPWAVYMSIGNLISIGGNAVIPTDSFSITPGKVEIVNQNGEPALLQTGESRRLNGSSDQVLLVSVTPQGQGETTFSLRPQLSVSIPPKTPPGLYRAMISIKII